MPMKTILHILFDADSLTSRILCVLVYILLYDFIYEKYIYGVFGYMEGIDYNPMGIIYFISWIIISILPIFFIIALMRYQPSCAFLYIFSYIFLLFTDYLSLTVCLLLKYSHMPSSYAYFSFCISSYTEFLL